MLTDRFLTYDSMLLPNSKIVVIWQITFSIITILYFSLSLMLLTFQLADAVDTFNSIPVTLLILITCLIDTILSLHIKKIQNGKTISNRRNNIKRYMKSKLFYTDLIVMVILALKILFRAINVSNTVLAALSLLFILKFSNIYVY